MKCVDPFRSVVLAQLAVMGLVPPNEMTYDACPRPIPLPGPTYRGFNRVTGRAGNGRGVLP